MTAADLPAVALVAFAAGMFLAFVWAVFRG